MWKNNGIDAVVAVTSLIWVVAVVCLVVGVLQRDLLALWCHDNASLLCWCFASASVEQFRRAWAWVNVCYWPVPRRHISRELADAILLQCALPLGIDDSDPNLREFSFKLSRYGQCGFLSWMFRFQPSIHFEFKTDFR